MTANEILRRVCFGHLLLVGEVRAAVVRESGRVDTKTGLKSTVWLMTYFVELMRQHGFEIVKIMRRVPAESSDPANAPVLVEKGKCYVFEIDSVEQKPGFLSAWMGSHEPQEVEIGEPASAAPSGAADGGRLILSIDKQLQEHP
jgi:hypothetical protein